jgi:putative ABC transport system permease protein
VLLTFIPNNVPGAREAPITGEVLCFTLGLTVLAGLLSGLIPALRISQIDDRENFTEKRRTRKFYSLPVSEMIVTAELALALVLLVGAGMITQNFWYLSRTDPGFNPEYVLTAQVSLSSSEYQKDTKKIDFYRQILERIRLLPGVRSVGIINNLPLTGQNINGTFYVEERPEQKHYAGFRIISPDYFQALDIPLLNGRLFAEQDDENASQVTIISRNLARQIWADGDPIGQRIRFIGMDQKSDVWMTVIGVIGDVKHSSLNSPPEAEVYVPYSQRPYRSQDMTIAVRTVHKPEDLVGGVRNEIRILDKNIPAQFETMQQLMSKTFAAKRYRSLALILFAFTTMALTLIGFYIIMKHEVARRLHELEEMTHISRQNHIYNSIRKGVFLSTVGIIAGLIAFSIISRIKPDIFGGIEEGNLSIFGTTGIIIFISNLIISYIAAYKTEHSNLTGLSIKEG